MAEYIEREAVMQKFADHVKRSNNSDFVPTPTWNQAVQIVEDIPIADVQPVVYGHWIVRRGNWQDEYECSVCHKVSKTLGNYCPNCGARMVDDGTK